MTVSQEPAANCANTTTTHSDVGTASVHTGANSTSHPSSTEQAYKIIFVLGGPGSGKGTQCSKLVEEFGVQHLSAGDLLRAHMKSGSPEGQMVADMIAQGQIVPSHVTISLLQCAMADSGKDKFLIDGFPRNEENRGAFEKLTGLAPTFIFFYDCPDEVMEKRLMGRNEGRTDDNIETIRKRFKVFIEQSMPVIEHYEKQGKVARINADRSPEDVYQETKRMYMECMV
jgi:UMP-CMP kinase